MDVLSKVKEVVTRADEAGGELRDRLIERYQGSARAQKLVSRLQQIRGKSAEVELRSQAERAAAEPVTAQDQGVESVPTGLGDAAVAAQIFGRSSCPWSGRAISLLENQRIDYDFVDLDDDDNAALEAPLLAETLQNTVPYVYLRGQFVGGFNALAEIERLGQLELAAMDRDERAASPDTQTVVIAPRPSSADSAAIDDVASNGREDDA